MRGGRRGLAGDARPRRDADRRAREPPPGSTAAEVEEATALLAWIADDHFTFLGYREYELLRDDGEVAARGRGHRARASCASAGRERVATASPSCRRACARSRSSRTCSSSPRPTRRSTVHRPAYLDYVGVKRFDAGGRRRRRAALPRPLHDGGVPRAAAARSRCCGARSRRCVDARRLPARQPRREGAGRDHRHVPARRAVPDRRATSCSRSRCGILDLGERQRVRLFMRRDRYERFVSCLVFLLRDRFNTANRVRIAGDPQRGVRRRERRLRAAPVRVGARAHPLHAAARRRATLPDVRRGEIEARIVEATALAGPTTCEAALVEEDGEEARRPRCSAATAMRSRRPTATTGSRARRSRTSQRIEALDDDDALAVSLYRPLEAAAGRRCAASSTAAASRASLSDVLPMFESMGLRVSDERPYEVTPRDAHADVDLRLRCRVRRRGELDADAVRERFQDGVRRASGTARPSTTASTGSSLARRAGLARGDDPARGRALPAPGRHRRSATATWSRRCSPIRDVAARARRALPARASIPTARPARDARTPIARRDRGGDRRRRQPRRGPDPAQLPARRARRCCARTTSSRRRRRPKPYLVVQARPDADPAAAAAAAALRDLRALAAGRGRAPARRLGRPRRPALVRPPRGLPHRDPRPDEGADGQERADRAGRREGRLRRQAPADGP